MNTCIRRTKTERNKITKKNDTNFDISCLKNLKNTRIKKEHIYFSLLLIIFHCKLQLQIEKRKKKEVFFFIVDPKQHHDLLKNKINTSAYTKKCLACYSEFDIERNS